MRYACETTLANTLALFSLMDHGQGEKSFSAAVYTSNISHVEGVECLVVVGE